MKSDATIAVPDLAQVETSEEDVQALHRYRTTDDNVPDSMFNQSNAEIEANSSNEQSTTRTQEDASGAGLVPTGNTGPRPLNHFANDVEKCVKDADTLRSTLDPLRARHLRGEAVQEDLSIVFQHHGEFWRIARWAAAGNLRRDLQKALNQTELEEATVRRFLAFWDDVQWVVPGVHAAKRERKGDLTNWTNIDVDIVDSDDLIAKERRIWGVDDQSETRASVERFLLDALARLERLRLQVEHLHQAEKVETECLEELAGTLEANEATDALENFLDGIESWSEDTGGSDETEQLTSCDEEQSGDDSQVDDTTALDGLGGANDDEDDTEDCDSSDRLRGFY